MSTLQPLIPSTIDLAEFGDFSVVSTPQSLAEMMDHIARDCVNNIKELELTYVDYDYSMYDAGVNYRPTTPLSVMIIQFNPTVSLKKYIIDFVALQGAALDTTGIEDHQWTLRRILESREILKVADCSRALSYVLNKGYAVVLNRVVDPAAVAQVWRLTSRNIDVDTFSIYDPQGLLSTVAPDDFKDDFLQRRRRVRAAHQRHHQRTGTSLMLNRPLNEHVVVDLIDASEYTLAHWQDNVARLADITPDGIHTLLHAEEVSVISMNLVQRGIQDVRDEIREYAG